MFGRFNVGTLHSLVCLPGPWACTDRVRGMPELAVSVPVWTFSDRLRKARRAYTSMEQRAFAEALGIGTSTYAAWESGPTGRPRDDKTLIDVARKVNALTGVSAEWLIGLGVDRLAPSPPWAQRRWRPRRRIATPSARNGRARLAAASTSQPGLLPLLPVGRGSFLPWQGRWEPAVSWRPQ